MNASPRIYLDNAATSWPKPEAVYQAVDRFQRELGAPAGRSTYAEAGEVSRLIEQARSRVAEILGTANPSTIAFCFNGTDALNAAIHGSLAKGGHVVTSDAEHNSVLRPLAHLASQGHIRVTYVPCNAVGQIDPQEVRGALQPETRLVVLLHASNVTGAIQPLREVGPMVKAHGALFLVDAAQSLGHFPFTVGELQCDLLAAPGHKGLLGPLGTGVLYVRPGVEKLLQSFRQGGTGTQSESDEHPDIMPYKFEAGNLNVAGIVGLGAGCQFVLENGIEAIHANASSLASQLREALLKVEGVELYGPTSAEERVGVVSFNVASIEPQEVVAALDSHYRVQARGGLHCAARIHRAINAAQRGGTVRFSIGPFNTVSDVKTAADAVAEIAAAAIELPSR
jgi:cysteine desulfurase / selenocysteine lyase